METWRWGEQYLLVLRLHCFSLYPIVLPKLVGSQSFTTDHKLRPILKSINRDLLFVTPRPYISRKKNAFASFPMWGDPSETQRRMILFMACTGVHSSNFLTAISYQWVEPFLRKMRATDIQGLRLRWRKSKYHSAKMSKDLMAIEGKDLDEVTMKSEIYGAL